MTTKVMERKAVDTPTPTTVVTYEDGMSAIKLALQKALDDETQQISFKLKDGRCKNANYMYKLGDDYAVTSGLNTGETKVQIIILASIAEVHILSKREYTRSNKNSKGIFLKRMKDSKHRDNFFMKLEKARKKENAILEELPDYLSTDTAIRAKYYLGKLEKTLRVKGNDLAHLECLEELKEALGM